MSLTFDVNIMEICPGVKKIWTGHDFVTDGKKRKFERKKYQVQGEITLECCHGYGPKVCLALLHLVVKTCTRFEDNPFENERLVCDTM